MKFFRDTWPVVVIAATIAGAAWTAEVVSLFRTTG